ncbi:hypothetical protein ACCT30_14200, partial [Rhizobium ruizarguesonis]
AFGSRGELANLPPEIVQDKSLQPDNYVDATFDLVEEADTVLTFAQRKWYIDVELKPNGTNVDLNSLYLPIDVVYIPQMTSQNIVVPFTDAGVPIGDFANAFGDLMHVVEGKVFRDHRIENEKLVIGATKRGALGKRHCHKQGDERAC